jgi:hypothetical protein
MLLECPRWTSSLPLDGSWIHFIRISGIYLANRPRWLLQSLIFLLTISPWSPPTKLLEYNRFCSALVLNLPFSIVPPPIWYNDFVYLLKTSHLWQEIQNFNSDACLDFFL